MQSRLCSDAYTNGIIAFCMIVLLICGLFDLSVGSAMGLSGIVCAILLSFGLPIPLAILAALLFGCAFGAVNGFLVATLEVRARMRITESIEDRFSLRHATSHFP